MDRDKIGKIIKKLEGISNNYSDDDFNLAVYILVRLGTHEFNNYIDNEQLNLINNELVNHDTIFDEDINDTVAEILEYM